MGIIHETVHARYEQGLPNHYQVFRYKVKPALWVFMNLNHCFEMQIGQVTALSPF